MKRQLQFLGFLSKTLTKLHSKDKFIAVSGSLGKTTTVRCAKLILSQKFKTLSTNPNEDFMLSVSSTLLKVNPTHKKVILEMGIKGEGDMDFYLSQVKPKVGVFTKITQFSKENSKLLDSLSGEVAILNWDDVYSKKMVEEFEGQIIYYGTDPQNCTVWAGNLRIENFRTTFELNLGVERVKVEFPLLGLHQVYPALAAATLGVVYDIPLTKIKRALESVQPEEHKLQLLLGPNGSFILDDTFSAQEVEGAIETLVQLPARRRILVLGDLGSEYTEKVISSLAQKIYKEKLDFVFLGINVNLIAEELKNLGFWEERLESNLQNSKIVGKLLKTLGKGDICLIKGSKLVRLDEVVKRISKK